MNTINTLDRKGTEIKNGNTFLGRCWFDRWLVGRYGDERRRHGVLGDIIVGVVGGLLGGWIASSLLHIGAGVSGINLESILVAFLGAVVLLVLLRLVGGRRLSFRRR